MYGETTVCLKMGDKQWSVRIVVIQLGGMQTIVGMNFQCTQHVHLDLGKGTFVCGGDKYELCHRQDPKSHLVRLDTVPDKYLKLATVSV